MLQQTERQNVSNEELERHMAQQALEEGDKGGDTVDLTMDDSGTESEQQMYQVYPDPGPIDVLPPSVVPLYDGIIAPLKADPVDYVEAYGVKARDVVDLFDTYHRFIDRQKTVSTMYKMIVVRRSR